VAHVLRFVLASNRFFQNAVLICDTEQVEELILGLENIDPHYKIIASLIPILPKTPQPIIPIVKI
jgi:hypothetical protein